MICKCYHDDINFIGERGVCWGTKEKEPCRCGGDETKCDFYPKRAVLCAKTNADRIRAMTDEELAEFIGDDPMHDICPSDCFEDPDRLCKVCALAWLKQEVKE